MQYIYALSNPTIPGLVKIGSTTKSPERRAKELSTSGVAYPFEVLCSLEVKDCTMREAQLHNFLKPFRHSDDREFFSLRLEAVYAMFCNLKLLFDAVDNGGSIPLILGCPEWEVCVGQQVLTAPVSSVMACRTPCQYCGKSIGKYGLLRHQKSKACLAVQGRCIQGEFKCDWCGDRFQRADIFKKHLGRCKQRTKALYTSIEDQLRNEIRMLKAEVKSRDNLLEFRDAEIDEHGAVVAELELENKLLRKEISVLTATPQVIQNITNNIRVDKFVVRQYAKDNFVALTDGVLKQCLSQSLKQGSV